MKEPSFLRLALRGAMRRLGGLDAGERAYCQMRDRLWLGKKLGRFSPAPVLETRLFNRPFRFLQFESLMRLIEEIFGRKIYSFTTENKRPLILDLGANIGMSILFFKRQWPEARVLAFEPDPKTFEVLSQNVKTHGWKDVELHNRAVSDKEGETDFYTDPTGNSSLESSLYGNRIAQAVKSRVKTSPLSRFITGPVDFLKMDIEGGEGAVLEELASSGALANIKAMAVEYHHHLVPGEDKLASFLGILEDRGFGYLISGPFQPAGVGNSFQDLLIQAWKK